MVSVNSTPLPAIYVRLALPSPSSALIHELLEVEQPVSLSFEQASLDS